MLDDGWCCMDTFATLSFDAILSIYICILCEIICKKLSNVAANFLKNPGVKSQCTQKCRGIFARTKLSLPNPFNTVRAPPMVWQFWFGIYCCLPTPNCKCKGKKYSHPQWFGILDLAIT
jgi:hypothetical protein